MVDFVAFYLKSTASSLLNNPNIILVNLIRNNESKVIEKKISSYSRPQKCLKCPWKNPLKTGPNNLMNQNGNKNFEASDPFSKLRFDSNKTMKN